MAHLLLATLLLAPIAAATGAQEPALEHFGRWERKLRRCRMGLRDNSPEGRSGADRNASERQYSCRTVRLAQQEQGLLSVRFLAAAPAPPGVNLQLAFAGVLEAGGRPMRCHQLRCKPHWPIRLQVSVVSLTGLIEPSGLSPLQQGRLARGSCDLNARRLRCSARGSNGEEWIAEGSP
jgi:hypothetical protein